MANPSKDLWPPSSDPGPGPGGGDRRPSGPTTFHRAGTLADLAANGGYAPQEMPYGVKDAKGYERMTSGTRGQDETGGDADN